MSDQYIPQELNMIVRSAESATYDAGLFDFT